MTCAPASRTRREGGTRARPQHAVLGDQRPVEIEGESGDVPRERRRGALRRRAAGRSHDVRGDVGDLLRRERVIERRHPAPAVRDLRGRVPVVRLLVVEVRADGAGRSGVGERVAATAVGWRKITLPFTGFPL